MDRDKIWNELLESYRQTHPKSQDFFEKASQFQIRGGSHNLRLYAPFPFFDAACSGSTVTDLDGNSYIDFWQGHFANVLGHNPQIVTDALSRQFAAGEGLITGFPGTLQAELAELILDRIGADRIRFTTSGALASMYAIMLAKAFNKRDLVMKMGGGWHGSQPFALKGVSHYDQGLDKIESAGLPRGIDDQIVVTGFNDPEDLRNKFEEYGDRVACLIMELMIGAGGLLFARPEYVQKAAALCRSYGALLIFDEVISGFRFHAGGLYSLYGIEPDLSIFGKCIGGGMPLSAVAGREEIVAQVDPKTGSGQPVRFDGGTFSAHPACMLAGITFIKHLIEQESEIYPKMGRFGANLRREIESTFLSYGFNVRCSGGGEPVAENSAMVGVHFLMDDVDSISAPEQAWNPAVCDLELREKILKLAMLEQGVNVFHGFGAVSAAHTEEEIQSCLEAVERIAKKWSE